MAEQETPRYDLFISHAQADRAWVEGYLLDALQAAGVAYRSEEAFALGAPRLTEFERAIQQSARTLLVLSPAYLADEFAQFTDLLAQTYGLETATWPVIPMILAPVDLPPRLAALVALDAADPDRREAVLARLLAELKRPVPEALPKPPCPYPGMVPFREADSDRFFGRDDEIDDLASKLRHQSLLFVIGPSGSGKSSLVRVGLVPRLHERQPGKWLVRTFRPAGSPLLSLCQALGIPDAEREQNWAQAVQTALAENAPMRRLLLIVDQFEELFAPDMEREAFLTAIVELRQVENCALVLAMRADFYHDLMNSSLWPVHPAQRVEIAPLRGDALREAIERPARDVGVYLEAGLLERLLADAATEPGVLPLVQETMQELWQRMKRRLLLLSAYGQLGSDGRSGLAVAVANKADATLLDLAPEEQTIARRMFLRLIQFGEGRPDTRRQQTASALRAAGDEPSLFDRTLDHLTGNRLLTVSGDPDDPERRVDISHEALIDGWPTLRGWVDERQEAELVRRTLEDKVAEWVRLGRGNGGLLDVVELAEAGRWLAGSDAAELGYSADLEDLVRVSRATIDEAEREREAARQRELAQAQALAEEQRRRVTEVEEQRQIALARQLAAQAELERSRAGGSWNLAGLLAAESLRRRSDAVEAVAVLYRVLGRRGLPVSRLEHDAAVWAMAFSPDGRWVATGSLDRIARVWEAATGAEVARLEHEDGVGAVAFSPDGRWVATASRDRTARVWRIATGAQMARLEHDGEVWSVAFSPDGRWVTTASEGRTARVWVAPASLMETLCLYLTRNLTQDEWQRYIGEEPYRCTCPNLPPGGGTGLDACPSPD